MIRGGTRQGPVVAVAVALAGCATGASQGNNLRKLPDGSYEVACRQTLATCLQAFETVCAWHGYDVISAAERRQRADLRDPAEETISSEAQVQLQVGRGPVWKLALRARTAPPPRPPPPCPRRPRPCPRGRPPRPSLPRWLLPRRRASLHRSAAARPLAPDRAREAPGAVAPR